MLFALMTLFCLFWVHWKEVGWILLFLVLFLWILAFGWIAIIALEKEQKCLIITSLIFDGAGIVFLTVNINSVYLDN